eukprot:530486-Amphidinium_carterae.1
MYHGSTTQQLYDHWLMGLNTWLAIPDSRQNRTHSKRGCAEDFFDEGVASRLAPRTESDTWRLHVLKKARCWSTEISNHAEGGCPGCGHCLLLKKKLSRLPLKKLSPHL